MTIESTRVEGRERRLARWRELLSRADIHEQGGRTLRKNASTNLLTGVWLHAAARAARGLELTDFERTLLEPLSNVVGQNEVLEVGRVYSEQRDKGECSGLVPQSITTRDLSQGFGIEEYRAAIAALGQVVIGLPNTQVVDRGKLLSGDDIDTPEFLAAAQEYGFGLTVFVGDDDDQAAKAPFRSCLEWGGFYCYEAVGDQWGGRDEIYWTAASATEGYGYHTRTKETGSVTEGHEYPIHGDWATSSKKFFDSNVEGCLGVVVTCWEADDSNAAWYDALGNALGQIADDMKLSADFSNLVPDMDLYGAMHTALSFLTDIWQWIRNEDDLVLSRGYAMGRSDLAALYQRPGRRMTWQFNAQSSGMGRFDLRVDYTGDKPGDVSEGSGTPIAQNWQGLIGTEFTTGIQAACHHPSNPNDVYLFKGSQYVRYDLTAAAIYIGPKSIAEGWPGLKNTIFTSNIDAVCARPGTNQVYLFKGSQYTRYNLDNEKMVNGVLNIAAEWPGLKNTIFTSNIDATCNVPGSNTDLYFFKGDTYVRYHLFDERIVVGPTKIADNWHALNGTSFISNINAACLRPASRHAELYLFQGSRYVRVNMQTGQIVP